MILDAKTDDNDLLALIAQGSQVAFELFYQRYANAVYSAVHKIIGAASDAEELVQDIFVYVWSKAALFDRTRGTGGTWLFTIARSRAIDFLRSKRSKMMQAEVTQEGDIEPETPDVSPAAAPLAALVASEEQQRIALALSQIPAEQREAIELAFFGGLSHTEVAEKLSQPLGTVKTRIRQGLMKLELLLR